MATVTRYSAAIRIMHWIMAILIIALLAMGWTMGQMEGPEKYQLMGIHKSLGLLALLLIIIRIALRLSSSVPASAKTVFGKLARIDHWLLYGFMFLIPASGFIMSWAGGRDTAFFSFFAIPGAVEKIPAIAGTAHSIHINANYGLGALIILHILAFAYHQFVEKEDLLKRISLKN